MPEFTKTRVVDWDEILGPHGDDVKETIIGILDEYNIDPDAPEAAMIASMFISHVETLNSFLAIQGRLEDGKEALSVQFTEQIMALRGVVSYAKENLIESSRAAIDKQQKEMLDVVSVGIRQSILKASSANNNRNLTQSIVGAIAGGVIAIISGGFCLWIGTSLLSPAAAPATAAIEPGSQVDDISQKNADAIKACIDNYETLGGKCVISIEAP